MPRYRSVNKQVIFDLFCLNGNYVCKGYIGVKGSKIVSGRPIISQSMSMHSNSAIYFAFYKQIKSGKFGYSF